MADLCLDRMAVDDAAKSPERIAAEIHRQLGPVSGAVPVYEIARALDIETIEERPLRRFEAMLLTGLERDFGHVLLNNRSRPGRRRYSLAHELGHFLCNWHRQTHPDGFACTKGDMTTRTGDGLHRRQEDEANRFAIELLAPSYLVAPYLRRLPDLDVVLAMHKRLDISKVAAARRYVNLHSTALALVVAGEGRFLYVERSADFPYLRYERGEYLPSLPPVGSGRPTSEMLDADTADWRLHDLAGRLFCQVLEQEENHALILLHWDRGDG